MGSCVYEEKRNGMRTKTGELNEPYLSSSKTIWEGKHKIRSNQMKAIAMERQSVCFISKVGRFSQSRTSTCGFDMKCDRFWSILIDSHENGETAKQDNEICKEKASAQLKTATKSFSRRYSVKRMMAEPKLRQVPRWYYIHWLKSLSGLPRVYSVSHTGNVSRA